MKNKYLFIFLVLFGFGLKSSGQTIGNEWINYSQKYFRIDIWKDSIYRIQYNTLADALNQVGVSVSTINPKRFQLFGRGVEIALYVSGESDNSFDPGDYIEFYARANDGWFDTRLYRDSLDQPNPYYSLFNDTASYYFTYNNLTSNKRMTIENGTNFSPYSEAPYFLKRSEINFNSEYQLGQLDDHGISQSGYIEGEGWTSGRFDVDYSWTQNFSTINPYLGGPAAEVEVCAQGRSGAMHHLQIEFPGQIVDSVYFGYPIIRTRVQIPTTLLANGNTPVTLRSIRDGSISNNYQAMSYFKISYPHTLSLESTSCYKLFLPVFGALPKAVLKVNSAAIASASDDIPLFYDLTNHIRISPVKSGTQFTCLVNNLGSTKEIYLTSEQKIAQINLLAPVNGTAVFTNFGAEPYLSSDYIIVTHKSLRAEAEQYKTYRQTSGYPQLYTPMIADIDELYDQFAYGIRKNPLSIRNLVRFAMTHFHQTPKNLFLIGKSYRAGENSTVMAIYRKNTTWYNLTLVPTFGVPPSDNLFSSGLVDPNDYSMSIPTGRLSAKVPEHVSLYLNKVQEHENALRSPQPWMKNVLHFAGGTGPLHSSILNYMRQFEAIIEDTLFGGNVRTIEKTTTEPIQINQSDSLKTIINNGVSLMTFFGHAAGIGFDISIDNPEEYNNAGKYPFLIGLSCFAGDLYSSTSGYNMASSSERFVLIPNRGTIAYLASVSTAQEVLLYQYTNEFYRNLGQRHYGKSIGYNIMQTINGFASQPYMNITCMDMTFHGDPAIVLSSFDKPDYAIEPSDISFYPTPVTTEYDSLTIHLQFRNIGRAISDSIMVRVKRTFPDNSVEEYLIQQKAPYFIDTLSLKMPVNRVKGVGANQITVTLDAFNEVDELSESNNSVLIPFSVVSSDIIPIYPPKYAVIDSNHVTLSASTGFPFLPATSFTIEIDTTDLFNSPLKQSAAIVSPGGIVQWNVPVALSDSMVYYWHIAKTGDTNWRESSFQYIEGQRGWGQSHFFQFKNDHYQLVNYNRPFRKFDYVQEIKSLSATTGTVGAGITWTEILYKVNGSVMDQWSCSGGYTLKVAVFNPISGKAWENPDSVRRFTLNNSGNMGQNMCPKQLGFDFMTSAIGSRDNLANFLDSIPNGYYVLAMSLGNINAPSYNEHLYSAFESIGSTKIRTLPNNIPYILFGKKGINLANPGDTVTEVHASNSTQVVTLSTEFRTNWDQGSVTSELIGPASSWGSAHWRINDVEASDSVYLQIIGVSEQGGEAILKSVPASMPDILDLESLVPVQQYPYLRLKLFSKDKSNNTPVQLNSWRVLYQPVPETAIDPVAYFKFYNPTIQEGDTVRFGVATRNISNMDMDSLLVTYRIIHNNVPVWTKTKRLPPHPAGDVLKDVVFSSTLGLQGLNTMQVEFNPDNDQPEQTHFNNIAEVNFHVIGDRINPMMDVTFDGVRIMNGDLVSSKPTIQITLKDENPFLLMNTLSDTTQFRIRLKSPKDADFVSVPFFRNGVQIMQFVPATSNNKCYIIYKGDFPVDGQYHLEIEAMDKSNNLSGINKYNILFEVQNKSAITDVMNWPNPFSSATHFVFTLAGSELPTYFKIQIMSVTGKLVREIDLAELGPLHIGRNITDYAWDGRDQVGDQLANGIYLYRVVSNINGEGIQKRESGASKYFTKDFGKMCLIR